MSALGLTLQATYDTDSAGAFAGTAEEFLAALELIIVDVVAATKAATIARFVPLAVAETAVLTERQKGIRDALAFASDAIKL